MKLPVVSGSDALKAFRNSYPAFAMSSTAATSFLDTPSHRTDAFPFLTAKNWPKGLFER